jgi:ABC-type polar amino acid transport system ATPase subunit
LVPQDDALHGWLTVEENLWLYARLRRRSGAPLAAVAAKVAAVMRVLGLYAHRNARSENVAPPKGCQGDAPKLIACQPKKPYTIVGWSRALSNVNRIGDPDRRRGLSGGQRKRVNVAMELVLDPSVLFLDEPSTGLDSASALDLIEALKLLAESRHLTVAAVVHQPSAKVFACFHDVLLLGAGGAADLGPSHGALPYLATLGFHVPAGECAADFMLDVTCGKVAPSSGAALAPCDLTAAWHRHASSALRSRPAEVPLGYGSALAAAGDRLGWRDRTLLVAAEQPWWIECFFLFAGRAVVEHLRFPAEFIYEVRASLNLPVA